MNELFNRYAFGLLQVAIEEDKVSDYREEIVILRTVLKENKEFIKLLGSTQLEDDEPYKLIEKNFSKFSPDIVSFMKVILKHGRSHYLYEIIKETQFRFDDYLNVERGTIYSRVPLSEKNIEKIKLAIEKHTKKRIELKNVIDEDIIGGIKVVLKNDLYDASIKTNIENLKAHLLKKGD